MSSDHSQDRAAIEASLMCWLRSENERSREAAKEVEKRMDALDGMYEDMQVNKIFLSIYVRISKLANRNG